MPSSFSETVPALDNSGTVTGTINPPNLSPSGKVRRRAIKDAQQCRAIVNSLEQASRERNIKNARIQAKANAEKPFSQQALEQDGLGWKSNWTSQPLPMLIGKVVPRFVKAEQAIKYLTNSALPDTTPGASEKTEAFRREITSTVRARPGWTDLISEIAQENALFGFTCVSWMDEFRWFPRHFRQDEFFVPSGTKHQPATAQVICLKEAFLIHELFALVEDNGPAEAAGWNIENTVNVINTAMPESRKSKGIGWERVQEDLLRESTVGTSLEGNSLVVTVWHLLAQEISGKVSHYIITDNKATSSGLEVKVEDSKSEILFEREDQFESMEMAAAFFSFEQANGRLHGSKGIGRQVYSMAAMLDRARNETVDRLMLAGKLIIQCGPKDIQKFRASIVGPALLIGEAYQISEQKVDAAVEPFMQLDQFLTAMLDQMAGAVSPKFFEGERVTKAQVDLYASREEESKDNIIGRFLSQFARMMQTIQRRLCSTKTVEEDAKKMQERLLQLMTREELDELANQPVAETIQDYTGQERQQVVLIAQEGRGNPLYNARELERRKLAALIDDEFADAVLLPEADPTEQAEQTRFQNIELMLLAGQATQVPISPRDNHILHLQTLMPALEAAAQSAAAPDSQSAAQGTEVLHAMLDHATQHYQAALQQGIPKEQLKDFGDVITKLTTAVEQVTQQVQQQQQLETQPPELPPSPEQLAAAGQPPTQ